MSSGKRIQFNHIEFDCTPLCQRTAVAHFTTGEAAEAILKSGVLQLNHVERMNDMREAIEPSALESNLDARMKVPRERRSALIAAAKLVYAKGIQLASFVQVQNAGQIIDSPDPVTIGTSCVANQLAWGIYGGRGAGAALVFDRSALLLSLHEVSQKIETIARSICYSRGASRRGIVLDLPWDEALIGLGDSEFSAATRKLALEVIRAQWETLIGTKELCWSWEQEWRLAVLSENYGARIELPIKRALRAVVLGPMCTRSSERATALVGAATAPTFHLHWGMAYDWRLTSVGLG